RRPEGRVLAVRRIAAGAAGERFPVLGALVRRRRPHPAAPDRRRPACRGRLPPGAGCDHPCVRSDLGPRLDARHDSRHGIAVLGAPPSSPVVSRHISRHAWRQLWGCGRQMRTIPLRTPEEIAARAGRETPVLHLPVRAEVFAERELRLRELAAGHAMRDYLLLLADLTRAQHELLQDHPGMPLPDEHALQAAVSAAKPPLPAELWPRDPCWRAGLQRLLDALQARLPEGPARSTVVALRELEPQLLEQQADRLLNGITLGLDLASAPFIAAALQVYWTHMVLATQAAHGAERLAPFGRIEDATRCPRSEEHTSEL